MDHNDDCSNDDDIFRNLSRVGDEYQTEIPSLITNSEYHDYIKNPNEEETNIKSPSNFMIGLDIPVVWINQEIVNTKNGIKNEVCLVPGCFLDSWSEIEKGSFVLGLYIFEKDFVQLKRFIEGKNMGDIMSYYYGKFYKSDEYKRWSECRKSRGKKCILGQRIFSGLRQQEFLSRLVPHVSQECQNSLLEVSRTFADGKISLEQYVFSLKTLIGIKMFIDSVAIGSGKQDLTGHAIEPTKQNQAIHIRPEIPIGKACSSLTSTEIIQFLTGDYRLSKARSNDLFWEAVWPRLLARGWHSEQPNGYNYAANGKHSLVFLMPGVKKFSRRLNKGDAYLDSVTDVLNKVASDPQLLEIDSDGNCEIEMKLEEDEEEEDGFHEKRKNHCYLQPRGPSLGNVVMKLTVVDTSLSGGNVVRVRELEPMKLTSRSQSDEVRSELVYSDGSDNGDTFLVDQETNSKGRKPVKKQKISDERKIPEIQDSILADPSRKVMKVNLTRKSRQENLGHHAKRRRRLTACSRVDSKENDDNHKLSSNLSFSSRCSSIDTVEERQLQQQEPQSINLIDLNYPHITPEFGNCESVTEIKDERNGPGLQKQTASIVSLENGVSRRQSTRNRPPTARALEAIANGFLTVNSRKKGKEDVSLSRSRSSRYSRGEIGVISECSTGDASSGVKGDDENGEIEK